MWDPSLGDRNDFDVAGVLRPWLEDLPITLTKAGKAAIKDREKALGGKQMVKVTVSKSGRTSVRPGYIEGFRVPAR